MHSRMNLKKKCEYFISSKFHLKVSIIVWGPHLMKLRSLVQIFLSPSLWGQNKLISSDWVLLFLLHTCKTLIAEAKFYQPTSPVNYEVLGS